MSLAIQVIASDGNAIPTMVFDEVDSGVGGGVAEMVGRRLAEVAHGRQVLCVTHLPQVASLADQHLRISKVTDGKATRTGVSVAGPRGTSRGNRPNAGWRGDYPEDAGPRGGDARRRAAKKSVAS